MNLEPLIAIPSHGEPMKGEELAFGNVGKRI